MNEYDKKCLNRKEEAQAQRQSYTGYDLAEQKLLGLLLDDGGLFRFVKGNLHQKDFSRNTYRLIFAAMQSLADRNLRVDLLAVADQLANTGTLQAVGGIDFLAYLLGRRQRIVDCALTLDTLVHAIKSRPAPHQSSDDSLVELARRLVEQKHILHAAVKLATPLLVEQRATLVSNLLRKELRDGDPRATTTMNELTAAINACAQALDAVLEPM